MSEFLDPSEEIHKHGKRLPHWQQPKSMQFLTFRLGDAMPETKIRQWREVLAIWLDHHPKPWSPKVEEEHQKRFVWKLEHWLDEGAGSCLLRNPDLRKHLENTIMHDHGKKAEIHALVIMPNHVHLLFTAHDQLESLVKSWKGISARRIQHGSIWQKGYRDTMIRDAEHFANAARYIRRNPSKLAPNTFTLWQGKRALQVI